MSVQQLDDIFYKSLVRYFDSLYCITTYAYCQYYNSFKANLQKNVFFDWLIIILSKTAKGW